MEYPVCKLWLILAKRYSSLQMLAKFSREHKLNYYKVRKYARNTFNKYDEGFALRLCEVVGCEFDEMFYDDKDDFLKHREANENYVQDKNKGVVYFVTNENNETKIGRTSNLKQRLCTLKNDPRGKGLSLAHTINSSDTRTLEKVLHKVFANKRIEGEWFELTTEDIDKLR